MFYKIKKNIVIPMIILLLVFSASAFADTGTGVTSEDVVSKDKKESVHEVARVEVTGSRLAEDIREVPAPAYVITKEEISRRHQQHMQEYGISYRGEKQSDKLIRYTHCWKCKKDINNIFVRLT